MEIIKLIHTSIPSQKKKQKKRKYLHQGGRIKKQGNGAVYGADG